MINLEIGQVNKEAMSLRSMNCPNLPKPTKKSFPQNPCSHIQSLFINYKSSTSNCNDNLQNCINNICATNISNNSHNNHCANNIINNYNNSNN